MDNRTAAFRFIPGDDKSQHIECRVGGADGNPYLVSAASIGAAILGIEQRLEPPQAVSGNAYEVEDSLPPEFRFPPTLRDAAKRFGQSRAARELFGEVFVDHYAQTRLWESREYERHVNDWQLARYFEII